MASEKHASDLQFTRRLEAFSDLVFGFSLSLLATRLDLPASADDIFSAGRWVPVTATFALICRFWTEHYRVFRHDFVAEGFDIVVNFVFLFSIAVFPYAVQIFFKFQTLRGPFTLYLGDVALVFVSLSILRVRGLRLRRGGADLEGRMKEWRRSVAQCTIALFLIGAVVTVGSYTGPVPEVVRNFAARFLGLMALVLLVERRAIKRLPRFLI